MKTIYFLLSFLPTVLAAQIFPFDEGFTGVISGTLPAGWQGDMQVQTDHGIDDMKGMAAAINSVDPEDSAITPWIGPLPANTEFYFWYRMVNQYIYPSTEKHLSSNDLFTISYSSDSVHYTTLFTIDSSTHQPSLNFRKITFSVLNLAGQTVRFKFYCRYGTGAGYFVDIDSVKVRYNPNTSTPAVQADPLFTCFPNPVQTNAAVQLHFATSAPHMVELYNNTGQRIRAGMISDEGSLPLGDVPSGVYVLHCGNTNRKLLILPQ